MLLLGIIFKIGGVFFVRGQYLEFKHFPHMLSNNDNEKWSFKLTFR